ncbi:hypothetical protein PoB_006800300 [Plakobranchus ocellatus]|uniref:Uncharacterized protein n=1 Tax=Plakobranchus ocellatus TaxID=259542 RepID=A0AAV4DBS8_9GAST|nr:hypothetical protein PoB_006800300 [Plakobranchus ocellatus]
MATPFPGDELCYNLPRGSIEFELVIKELWTEQNLTTECLDDQNQTDVVHAEATTTTVRPAKPSRALRRSNTTVGSQLRSLTRTQSFSPINRRVFHRRTDSFTVNSKGGLSFCNLRDIAE